MSTPEKQRLALFLDGTWNTEDDSTNVLNAYHYTQEGSIDEKTSQKRYYDRGVGTGMFDSVMGGGFGYGLEANVRQAYNWLVDHYNDGDEIYIFGFSRGAYTARSLVGLIASCGLVRRGAPLTITQLWNGYAFISKHRSIKDNSWWEKELKKKENKHCFRRITHLRYNNGKDGKPINYTDSEKLLLKWSHRSTGMITYLGIYDTVGAMGIHALGIPGLRSRLDENHNLNPTSLLKKCRHALAIDEHRTSFRLTPILDYVKNKYDKGKTDACREEHTERYKEIIHQKWFVGAHSNIGGGYANNKLSIRPLEWMIEGAKEAGLTLLDLPKNETPLTKIQKTVPGYRDIRDSFAELAGLIWPHFLREKRNLREIGRDDLVRSGYTLRSINEEVDESVFTLAKDKAYAPPNLLAYLRKHPERDQNQVFEGREPQQKWPGEILIYQEEEGISAFKRFLNNWMLPRILLILWCVFAALGAVKILQLFWVDPIPIESLGYSLIAALFLFVDWGESRVTLESVFYPKAVISKVIWNILYWIRLFGILAFCVGLIYSIVKFISLGLEINLTIFGILEFFKEIGTTIFQWKYWIPVVSVTGMMFILDYFGRYLSLNRKENVIAFKSNKVEGEKTDSKIIAIMAGVVSVLLFLFFLYSLPELWNYQAGAFSSTDTERLAGKLLLTYILLITFFVLFSWVGKSMSKSKANLGSILALQNAYTNTRITLLFNHWMKQLSRDWVDKENQEQLAWTRLREVLRIALWRDILGFIPLYSIILGTVLYIGSETYSLYTSNEVWKLTLFGETSIPWWLALVIVTALADILENTIHLQYVKNYPRLGKGGSNGLVIIGIAATFIKFVGFFLATLISYGVILFLIIIMLTNVGEWRWFIASGLVYALLVGVVLRLTR